MAKTPGRFVLAVQIHTHAEFIVIRVCVCVLTRQRCNLAVVCVNKKKEKDRKLRTGLGSVQGFRLCAGRPFLSRAAEEPSAVDLA